MLLSIKLVGTENHGGLYMAGFYEPGPRVAYITSVPISLTASESYGHCHLQRKLGNVVQLFVWEEKEVGLLRK